MKNLAFLLLSLFSLFISPRNYLIAQAITELAIVHSNDANVGPPSGFTKINVDLNSGSYAFDPNPFGCFCNARYGEFIYLCYRKGTSAPITGIAVTINSESPPAGYTKINVRLNSSSDGDDIYLWYTKRLDCESLQNVQVILNSAGTPAGYAKINKDLNSGLARSLTAGADYVYVCYQK